MKPTFQEAIAGIIAILGLLGVLVLSALSATIPNELWTVITSAIVFILGSRTSQPT